MDGFVKVLQLLAALSLSAACDIFQYSISGYFVHRE